jgi:hypothetical protein
LRRIGNGDEKDKLVTSLFNPRNQIWRFQMKKLMLTSLLALLAVAGCQTAGAATLEEGNRAVVEGIGSANIDGDLDTDGDQLNSQEGTSLNPRLSTPRNDYWGTFYGDPLYTQEDTALNPRLSTSRNDYWGIHYGDPSYSQEDTALNLRLSTSRNDYWGIHYGDPSYSHEDTVLNPRLSTSRNDYWGIHWGDPSYSQ